MMKQRIHLVKSLLTANHRAAPSSHPNCIPT